MKRARILARNLHNDRSGAVLIWVSILILVLFGFVALAIDGARYLNLNSNMQQVADAAALAGAKELDGSASAMKNATKIAKDYLTNNVNWSDIARPNGTTSDIITVNFYDAPPNADGSSTPLTDDKAGNQKASYIEVITRDRGLNTTFARSTGTDDAYTSARAVARVSYSVCKPIQSFLCNPWELEGPNGGESASELGKAANFSSPNVKPGDLFLLGAGTSNGPGDWGYISPLIDTNASASQLELQNFWASDSAPTCTPVAVGKQLGPITDPGNDAGRKSVAGMNVRFDIPNKTNGAIPSVRAPVVNDGYILNGPTSANNCASTTSATPNYNGVYTTTQVPKPSGNGNMNLNSTPVCTFAQVSPSDTTSYRNYCNARNASATLPAAAPCTGNNSCVTTSACPAITAGSYRVGSCPFPRDPDLGVEQWGGVKRGRGANLDDLKAYWSNHHSTGYPSGVTTRYGLYQEELKNVANAGSGYFDALGAGTGRLEPFSNNPPSTNPYACQNSSVGTIDRRLISVAIVDCDYWGINGKSSRLPTLTKNAVFFMTEPATDDSYQAGVANSDVGRIYGEFVGAYDVNMSGGSIFQQVELVR